MKFFMYFIQENNKEGKVYQFFVKCFNIAILEGNLIKVAPIADGENKSKQVERVAKKTISILDKTNSKKVILSKNLKNEKDYMNFLYSRNLDIVEGKWLFKVLSIEVLKYIINTLKIEEKDLKIAILVNDTNSVAMGSIYKIIHMYKNINIVTNHVAKFKKMQKELYENEGIVVSVTNNKRKSLAKMNIILNFDFPEELINKYSIYENANIVNFQNKVKIQKKRFNGINIYDYEIKCNKEKLNEIVKYEENIIEHFFAKDIYEAHFYKKQSFERVRAIVEEDKLQIKFLLTNNGRL